MKHICRIIILACLTLLHLSCQSSDNSIEGLKKWLEKDKKGKSLYKEKFAKSPLTREEAKEAAEILYTAKQQQTIDRYEENWKKYQVKQGDKTMFFSYKVFGEKPADGRSFYISMHGGGNTAKAVNDQQWRNQIHLYTPEEGVYLAPRAAVDDWNMWFQPHVDTIFDAMIQMAVATLDVNPNKVYIMGYSAGGDGTYRMAPRMADRWAAAAMMAGHPGDVSALNLRNIGFTLWMGGDDAAYDRNKTAAVFGRTLDSLHQADPKGYMHEVHILPGKPHWMDRADTVAIPWMAKFRRNPYPEKVVWKQDKVLPVTSFYWLAVPEKEAVADKLAVVERNGNTFTILENDYKTISIGLNDRMIDYSQPVIIISNGKEIYNGTVTRNIGDIYYSISKKGDRDLIFDTYLTVKGDKVTQGVEL